MVTSLTPFELFQQQYPDIQVQPWPLLEPVLQQQFQTTGIQATSCAGILYPHTQVQLANCIALAHQHQWPILPYGAGSKLSWGGLPQSVIWGLSTARVNQLVDHAIADMTVTVEAGMKLTDLQQILAKSGQFLPLDPLYGSHATVGGLIATSSAGSLRQRYGGVRDLLLGITFARSDGQLVKAGGRVVKNVAGYDLMKLLTGSFGTLGVLTQATFRVYALPELAQTVVLSGDRSALTQALQNILFSALTPTALDFLSVQLAKDLGVAQQDALLIRFQTIPAGIQAQGQQVQQLAHALNLQFTLYDADTDKNLWQTLPSLMEQNPPPYNFLCKIGVKPIFAGELLTALQAYWPSDTLSLIHGGSGIGWVRSAEPQPDVLQFLRDQCEHWGGFLTVLEASPDLKRQIEVWGYTGNALGIMQRLKQKFDPNQILSPGRFVGGI